MSCNLSIIKNFRLSRTLFTKEDGSPTLFYAARPTDDLRDIIEGGGGVLMTESELEQNEDECIKLCDNRNDPEIKQGYLPISYVKHCVMRNKLIGAQFYRETQLCHGQGHTSSPIEKEDPSSHGGNTESRVMVCPQIIGRKKYTLAEDLNIIKYLVNLKTLPQVAGNAVWRKMEALKITDHSFQSMRYRYLKSILPSIRQYNIPSVWISKLTRMHTTWAQREGDEEEADTADDEEEEEDDNETLDPEDGKDTREKPVFGVEKEKSAASKPNPVSKVSERHRKIMPDSVGVTCHRRGEEGVDRTMSNNTMSEDDFSLESNDVIEVFSVKTDNPSLRCKAKDPKFTNSSSLADSDDVDRWIVKEIRDERTDQSQRPSISKAQVSADQRLLPTHVRVPRTKEFQQSPAPRQKDFQPSPPKRSNFHPEDFASRQLTRHRLEAIMRHYNISQTEAVYLWLKHPHKLWQIL